MNGMQKHRTSNGCRATADPRFAMQLSATVVARIGTVNHPMCCRASRRQNHLSVSPAGQRHGSTFRFMERGPNVANHPSVSKIGTSPRPSSHLAHSPCQTRRGRIFRRLFEERATELAGLSSAKLESSTGDFLSLGERIKGEDERQHKHFFAASHYSSVPNCLWPQGCDAGARIVLAHRHRQMISCASHLPRTS
jgi:hypothetical protein